MPYLIDGHNLIAAMPGISLSDLDDEQALLRRLAEFAVKSRRSLTVYFDRGSLSAPPISSLAGVKVHFVRPPRTADDAIRSQLERLGGEAANWTVVSSDRGVHASARQVGARIIDSDQFAARLNQEALASDQSEDKPELTLSADELDEWERLFSHPHSPDHSS